MPARRATTIRIVKEMPILSVIQCKEHVTSSGTNSRRPLIRSLVVYAINRTQKQARNFASGSPSKTTKGKEQWDTKDKHAQACTHRD